MKLRTMLTTVALGASLLTAVPAAVFPSVASATCDQYSQCWEDWDVSVDVVGYQYLPQVIVDGLYDRPSAPAWDPNWSNYSGGGGGTPNDPPAQKVEEGGKEEVRQDCIRNNTSGTVKQTTNSSYNVSYQISANVSASARSILSASLGVTFGATVTRGTTIEITIGAGQGWALYVEYQNNLYKVLTPNGLEYVTVKEPTGVVRVGAC